MRGIRGRVRCDDQIDEASPPREASLSALLNATTRTNRDDNATPEPRTRGGSPAPVLLLHVRVAAEEVVPILEFDA
jgi:hypothetical protein